MLAYALRLYTVQTGYSRYNMSEVVTAPGHAASNRFHWQNSQRTTPVSPCPSLQAGVLGGFHLQWRSLEPILPRQTQPPGICMQPAIICAAIAASATLVPRAQLWVISSHVDQFMLGGISGAPTGRFLLSDLTTPRTGDCRTMWTDPATISGPTKHAARRSYGTRHGMCQRRMQSNHRPKGMGNGVPGSLHLPHMAPKHGPACRALHKGEYFRFDVPQIPRPCPPLHPPLRHSPG